MRLIFLAPCFGLLAAACVSATPADDISTEQACLQHYQNDPIGRDRCRLPPESRSGTVPDARPQDLPLPSTRGPGEQPS